MSNRERQKSCSLSQDAYLRNSTFSHGCEIVVLYEDVVNGSPPDSGKCGSTEDHLSVIKSVDDRLVLLPLVGFHFEELYIIISVSSIN